LARENYSYKKYQKELARKKKREEKLQKRLNKKRIGPGAEPAVLPDENIPAA